MSRHSHSIEIIKQIIIAHQKLFVDIYLTDSPEVEAIVDQMIHGKLHHKSIKLYQYLVEAFILSEPINVIPAAPGQIRNEPVSRLKWPKGAPA